MNTDNYLDRALSVPNQGVMQEFVEKQERYQPSFSDRISPYSKEGDSSRLTRFKAILPESKEVGRFVGERVGATYGEPIINTTIDFIYSFMMVEAANQGVLAGFGNAARNGAIIAGREASKLAITPAASVVLPTVLGPVGSFSVIAVQFLAAKLIDRAKTDPKFDPSTIKTFEDLITVDEEGVVRDAAGYAMTQEDLSDLSIACRTYDLSIRILASKRGDIRELMTSYLTMNGWFDGSGGGIKYLDGTEVSDEMLEKIETVIHLLEIDNNNAIAKGNIIPEVIMDLAQHTTRKPEAKPTQEPASIALSEEGEEVKAFDLTQPFILGKGGKAIYPEKMAFRLVEEEELHWTDRVF